MPSCNVKEDTIKKRIMSLRHAAEPGRPPQAELRRLKGLLMERGVPDGLICPLSLEIYEDPVMAADGFSYERREIENWFARGKRTSPKTNEELPHVMLVPNREVRQYEVSEL